MTATSADAEIVPNRATNARTSSLSLLPIAATTLARLSSSAIAVV
jgi:hypothetical protein